jgi:glycosyltransferase involved in cell wall biosynthesis
MPSNVEQPLVAIGLKTYNREAYLKRALESLLAQTYKNFVLIVSDNASPDGTQALCESFAKRDRRIRYVRQDRNIGVFANFNFTIREVVAAADYCLLASDDDRWEPTFLERCMRALITEREAVLAFPDFGSLFYGDGRIERCDPKKFFPFEKNLYARLKRLILLYSTEERGTPLHGVWRTSALVHEVIGDYYEHDVSFLLRGLSRGPFVFIDELLFYKGMLPGRESIKGQPLNVGRILYAFKNRFQRTGTEFRNMGFLLGVSGLSYLEKLKLIWWELFVIGRLFVQRKT